MCKVIGIDISKQTFDVCIRKERKLIHLIFENNPKGFKKFLKKMDLDTDFVVMEASGPYYVRLASFLFESNVVVSVVNPLIIKRFSQMKFYRAKTDKKDANIIMEYGETEFSNLRVWQPESKEVHQLKQLHSAIELLRKQFRQSKNQLEAFTSSGLLDPIVKKCLGKDIQQLIKHIELLESTMLKICKDQYSESLELLTSIPSIGNKTAVLLIAITDNFTKFEHYKQLIAYVGFSPRTYQSGTSVRGKGHICKMGSSQIRKVLYMCTWTAKRCNKGCVTMYDRLKEKGKPERVIKVALANKLLKQAFAIATSKQKYNENYQLNVCF
jgi:transposase